MFKAVICVVYADACLFWAHLKYNIDNVMKSFNEYRSSYNWEQSKGESVSEFLCIYIKTLVYGGFKFFPTGLIFKVLEATGMYYCNGLPTPTKVQAPLGTDNNGYKSKIYWNNSYDSVIGMMLYM